MRLLRAAWRVLRASLHVLHGMLIVGTRFDGIDTPRRRQYVQWWSAKYLRLLGVGLVVVGEAARESNGAPNRGPALVVANHISWLDILAINAVSPTRFVSKSEVRDWPLLGWFVGAAGTLYIERGRPRDARRVVETMADSLRAGDRIAVFPEGTTSDGHDLLPFHANLLQAAVVAGVPVQPMALRYSDPKHAISPAAAYVGDTNLFTSLGWVVMASGLTATVRLLEPLAASGDRRELAYAAEAAIRRALAG